jgi:hypothetical protein
MRTLQPFDPAISSNSSWYWGSPVINNVEEYRRVLLAVLRAHTDAALAKLEQINNVLPEKTRGIVIMVHPSQDPDGRFSVMVHLDGPDLYVLNKAIGDFRSLFDVQDAAGAVLPDVPLFDPFDEPFSVNDAIVDIAMVWIKELWATFGGMTMRVPVTMIGEDGYGTTPRVSLAD